MPDEARIKAWVCARHYSGSLPASRFRFFLHRAGRPVGAAVFSWPMNEASFRGLPGAGLERVELGRLVLEDEVPANGESFFVGRCFAALRELGIRGVLSMSDPVRRVAEGGAVIAPGHVGIVYQALNACYAGRGTARTLHLLPNGRVMSARSQQKIRAGERGDGYAIRQLEESGARRYERGEPRAAWLKEALETTCRPLRHPGNQRYLWALQRRDRGALQASLPYPKVIEASLV